MPLMRYATTCIPSAPSTRIAPARGTGGTRSEQPDGAVNIAQR